MRKTLLLAGLLLVAAVIAQTPTGGSLWTYYLAGGAWRWARLDVESPLQVDTSGPVARLRVLLPDPPAIRETEDVYVVKPTDTPPLSFTLRQPPVPESLRVVVMGLEYTLEHQYEFTPPATVTFLPGHSPTDGAVVKFRYRY